MKINVVLLEVASIQQYVFGSNKLKENLGASYIVENIFKSNLKNAFETLSIKINLDEWLINSEISLCSSDTPAEVGYIGGGNALLLFKDNALAGELAKQWSKNLLVNAPGLLPSIAINEMECAHLMDKDKFQDEIKKLFKRLSDNKYKNQPQTSLPRHGITAECSHTGLSAECYYKDKEDNGYISSAAMAKIENAEKANEELLKKFHKILGNKRFPLKLDKLGQKEGDNHISIVHIDGNGMGKRFQSCRTLAELRNLSKTVRQATENSFEALLNYIIQNYDYFKNKENFDLSDNVLPIRPIIMGGDDITFVSHGKLGIMFAEIFMKAFAEQHVSDSEKPSLSSCAGIAITKTKYPFYRGYQLAEYLCSEAKKCSRSNLEKDSSWLDFHIAYGGFSGSITEIRENNFKVSEGNLCLRPYRVSGENHDLRDFNECLKGIRHLTISENTKWPNSKLLELREVLGLGIPSIEMFIKDMDYRGRALPDAVEHPECKEKGWTNDEKNNKKVTPYFDMLELMKFYPFDLIDRGVNK